METECHLKGMLDRDQRTAKMILREAKEEPETIFSSCRCCREDHNRNLRNIRADSHVSHDFAVPRRTSPSACGIREKQRRTRHFWVTLSRLYRTVILCFYLTLFTFPTTLSAPVRMEKWMMPCGGHSGSSSNSNKLDLLQTIIDQSKRSLVMVETFKDKFAMESFGINWEDLQSTIPSLKWFPKINKELGKPISKEELDEIELNSLLKDTYQYLQIVAVAVDQMIIEDESKKGLLVNDYKNNIELYVLSVLCEIQTATNSLNVVRHKDVERKIIDPNDKDGDHTTMRTRHYLIIRDYIRILEYIIECYEHVKSKL